jgi:1-acyl-sn-glycerol-3-phosphate acyltransferase
MVEKRSVGYWMLRLYVNFAYWLFHRKIIVVGKENIPKDKPVIYAPNHPNALNDDLGVIYSTPHQIVWLGRADLFKSALARPFLRFIKIIPVYRIRDGKESLDKNKRTFATAVNVLKHNHAVGLYPEAAHSVNRQMLPHKKAVPRIVFLAGEMTGFSLDIKIVPAGIYFDQYQKFGRRLLIIYGKSLDAKNYYTEYQRNSFNATMALRNDLYQAILPLTLNFNTINNYAGFEAVRTICSKSITEEQGETDTMVHRFATDQQLIGKLDKLEDNDPAKAAKLANSATEFITRLNSLGLRSWLVDKKEEKLLKLVLPVLFLLLTFPLFLFGFLFNVLPFFLLNSLVQRKVKQEIFKSTFGFAIGIFLFPLFYLTEMLIVSQILPGWYTKILFLISLPFAGKFAFSWYILFLKTRGRWRWLKIKRSKPEVYNDIHRNKQEIIDEIASESFS